MVLVVVPTVKMTHVAVLPTREDAVRYIKIVHKIEEYDKPGFIYCQGELEEVN